MASEDDSTSRTEEATSLKQTLKEYEGGQSVVADNCYELFN